MRVKGVRIFRVMIVERLYSLQSEQNRFKGHLNDARYISLSL